MRRYEAPAYGRLPLLTIREPEPVSVSIRVDRDQNGRIDRLVDCPVRAVAAGRILSCFPTGGNDLDGLRTFPVSGEIAGRH